MTRRAKCVLAFWLLLVGGLVVHSITGSPTDNVTHRPAQCEHVHWDHAQARYVTYDTTEGGGCK